MIGRAAKGPGNPIQSKWKLEVFSSLGVSELRRNVVGFFFQGIKDVHSRHGKIEVPGTIKRWRERSLATRVIGCLPRGGPQNRFYGLWFRKISVKRVKSYGTLRTFPALDPRTIHMHQEGARIPAMPKTLH